MCLLISFEGTRANIYWIATHKTYTAFAKRRNLLQVNDENALSWELLPRRAYQNHERQYNLSRRCSTRTSSRGVRKISPKCEKRVIKTHFFCHPIKFPLTTFWGKNYTFRFKTRQRPSQLPIITQFSQLVHSVSHFPEGWGVLICAGTREIWMVPSRPHFPFSMPSKCSLVFFKEMDLRLEFQDFILIWSMPARKVQNVHSHRNSLILLSVNAIGF